MAVVERANRPWGSCDTAAPSSYMNDASSLRLYATKLQRSAWAHEGRQNTHAIRLNCKGTPHQREDSSACTTYTAQRRMAFACRSTGLDAPRRMTEQPSDGGQPSRTMYLRGVQQHAQWRRQVVGIPPRRHGRGTNVRVATATATVERAAFLFHWVRAQAQAPTRAYESVTRGSMSVIQQGARSTLCGGSMAWTAGMPTCTPRTNRVARRHLVDVVRGRNDGCPRQTREAVQQRSLRGRGHTVMWRHVPQRRCMCMHTSLQ